MVTGRLVIITYSEVFDDEIWGEKDDDELFAFMYEQVVGVFPGEEEVEPYEG